MRILIIEDEEKIATFLAKGLREMGFITNCARNGEEGLYHAIEGSYDIILLDVMLPKMDGFTLIKALRAVSQEVRIIFLTAKDSVEDRVKGLSLGADDYLVKPFAFSELVARINSLLRRQNSSISSEIRVGGLLIDLAKHKVSRLNHKIELTAKEFALLHLLATRAGEVLSRTFITEQIWDINFDRDTNVIDVLIKRLRQKVDLPFATKLIHTIRGRGYILEERSVL